MLTSFSKDARCLVDELSLISVDLSCSGLGALIPLAESGDACYYNIHFKLSSKSL